MTSKRRGVVQRAITVSLVLLAAACGSSIDDEPAAPASTTTTTTAAPSSSTTTEAPSTTTVAVTTTTIDAREEFDLANDGDDPLIFFGAVPPKPESVDYEIPLGSTDYFELFAPDAPWAEALSKIDSFRLHAFQMRHYLSDDDLRLIIDWLDEHQIPLLFETEPLQPVDPDECDHSESFEGPYDLEMARRFKRLGGTIDVVAIEQPYTYAHKLEGPRVCHYTLERIVDEVTIYMTEMRRMFPDVPMGSIEGLVRRPVSTPDDMALWLDSYEELAGEPFAFLHIDVDWTVPGWADILRDIEAVADERNVPFGVLYNGGFETSSNTWLQQAAEFIAEYETNTGGTPDHVNLVSWVSQPDRVLPDDDLGAFTSLINRYVGTRAVLEPLVMTTTDAGAVASGRLADLDGVGLADREIEVAIIFDRPPAATARASGVVPADATTASVLVRANVEGAVNGQTRFQLYDVRYSEAGGENRVPNGDYAQGGRWWYIEGDPPGGAAIIRSDAELEVGSGNMLSFDAASGQIVFVNGEAFPVTPGAEFDFDATFAVDPTLDGIGTVSVAFLNPDTRTVIRIEPVAQSMRPVVTDGDGRFEIELPDVVGGYTIELRSAGDLATWPALGKARIDD